MTAATASHILVQSEQYCLDVKQMAEEGNESFASLARRHSRCVLSARVVCGRVVCAEKRACSCFVISVRLCVRSVRVPLPTCTFECIILHSIRFDSIPFHSFQFSCLARAAVWCTGVSPMHRVLGTL